MAPPLTKIIIYPEEESTRVVNDGIRYELSNCEWTAVKPMQPNKPRGVRPVNDRRVLNGIFWEKANVL